MKTTTETEYVFRFEDGTVREFSGNTNWIVETAKAWKMAGIKFTAEKVTRVITETTEAIEF